MNRIPDRPNRFIHVNHLRNLVLAVFGFLLIAIAAVVMPGNPRSTYASNDLPAQITETQLPIRATPLPSSTPNPTQIPTPTRTPIPAYMLDNAHSTDGIIVGTLILVVIVLIGTVAGIAIRRRQHPD